MKGPESGQDPVATRLVPLGVVTRPHGVRGEVRVRPFHEGSEGLARAEALWLWPPETPEEAQRVGVLARRRLPKAWLLRLAGVGDRDTAEELRGLLLGLRRGELPPPSDDELYVVDLEGLRVVDAAGADLGCVEAVVPYPSVTCLSVRAPDGVVREVPLLAPWYVEARLEAGEVVLDRIEELPSVPPGRGRGRGGSP